MALTILLPCFNEALNAPKVEAQLMPVARALASTTAVEILVVDDGSTDGTRAAFERIGRRHGSATLRLRVVAHEQNRGLGAALRTGFAHATGEVVVTTDADGTYRFSEIPALLDRLQAGVDIVTASPYHPDGAVAGVPPHRLVLSRASSWIYRRVAGGEIHTYTALFRVYRRHVLETVPFTSDGFLAGTEILVNALRAGSRAVEYPTVLHARTFGTSKAKLWQTIKAHLRFQAQVGLARLGLVAAPWAGVAPGAGAASPCEAARPRARASAG
jgi:dolichol-phosphate mannosyltransferase